MSVTLGRRALLRTGTALGVLHLAGAAALAVPTIRRATAAPPGNRAPLARQPLQLLPVGAVRPTGWLRRQLVIQARGLGGRLDETWPDVGPDSGWLGGKGESWERGPYWIDGLLPLAWQLDDPVLKDKARRFIDWTLSSQRPDGMFGPTSNDDWWPRMVMLKAITQHHELTGDPRVLPFMTAYFAHQLREMPARPLKDWGRFRWQDEVVSVIWLYNRTGDPRLLDLARLLKEQGFNWQTLFADYPYRGKTGKAAIGLDRPDVPGEPPQGLKDPALAVHGVNNAQGIKASPVWSVVSGKREDREAVHRQLDELDRWHGLPIGIFSADEHLAGRGASQGVETCAVVETMYSLQLALAITGDAALADRLERIAFNALPAAFTDDMWAHQYDQQPNQVACTRAAGPWTTNGPESNLFGLEPHFGCCTANFHQGWPKLTSSLWMATEDGGLAAAIWAPCEVSTMVGDVPVVITQETDYPFRGSIVIRVDPARPATFPLHLRRPAWAEDATIRVNGLPCDVGRPGAFVRVVREWRRGDRVEVAFTARPRAVPGPGGAISFERGALVYALPIEAHWTRWRRRGLTADWEVRPAGPWATAVAADAPLAAVERPVGPIPFSARTPAVVLVTEGRRVAGWTTTDGSADPVPARPAVHGRAERLVLLPYGAPKLRLTAFATDRS